MINFPKLEFTSFCCYCSGHVFTFSTSVCWTYHMDQLEGAAVLSIERGTKPDDPHNSRQPEHFCAKFQISNINNRALASLVQGTSIHII